jgi:hypothetical protein
MSTLFELLVDARSGVGDVRPAVVLAAVKDAARR